MTMNTDEEDVIITNFTTLKEMFPDIEDETIWDVFTSVNCNCNFNSQRILETNFINIFDPTFVQTIKSNPQSEDSKML